VAKTAQISLGGTQYTIHAFNIGELERVVEMFDGPTTKAAFGIVRIGLERAEPKVEIDTLEPTLDEMREAARVMLDLAGLQQPDASPRLAAVSA
jgi:hypothetical protein